MFEKVFIIAEAGSNHNGKLETAVELLKKAKEAGADAIKFQDYTLSSLFSPPHYKKVLRLKDDNWQKNVNTLSFNPKWHTVLAEEADRHSINYFSTPYSLEAVDMLEDFVPFYKISSGDITFKPLLERIGQKGKGVFISTGASYISEIDDALRILQGFNLPFICVMHCIMLYPAPAEHLNLNFIETLKDRYSLPVGFSDHSLGIDASLIAVGKGVKAIEKHFTLDKRETGADHHISLEPDEFSDFIDNVREAEKMLGTSQRYISERENNERIFARRSIYSKVKLKKGERLTVDKIDFLRPNIAVGAEQIDEIINSILTDDVDAGAAIEYKNLTEK
ncbi:MAG: N-acetylneuraminate synthase family protein [Spirochaetota bacterium]|nr:MAG: N-acetylneuraminate synthase family protein [Spirochaetota bacterium]